MACLIPLGGFAPRIYVHTALTHMYGFIGSEIKKQVHVETMPLQLDFIPFGGASVKKHVILHFYILPCPFPPPFPQAADS